MNALIAFRSNATGNLVPTRTQRQQAAESVTANLRAKVTGLLREQAKAQGAQASSAKAGAAKATKSDDASAVTDAVQNELGKDAFLQLLVQQLSNQDPLEPMDNSQMVTQLAQFSALEQQTELNASFEVLAQRIEFLNGNVDQLNFISAQGMLGKYVEGIDINGEFVGGVVDSVHLEGSIVVLAIGETVLPMTGVIGVADEEPSEPINDPETVPAPDPEETPQTPAEEPGDGTAKRLGS